MHLEVNTSEMGSMLEKGNPSGKTANNDEFILESKINKISFICFGIGMLLPWNAMLASMDFFEGVFPSYKPNFSILVAVSAPMFVVQAIAFFFLQMIP